MPKFPKSNHSSNDPEFGVDSRYSVLKDQVEDSKTLMEARLQRMQGLTKDQLVKARLLQLRFKMKTFVQSEALSDQQEDQFLAYLQFYIDTLYRKRKDFAQDINETPIMLSKILNGHVSPKKVFMLKLIVHSEKIFQEIGPFEKGLWYQVYHRQALEHLLNQEAEWLPTVKHLVKTKGLAKA